MLSTGGRWPPRRHKLALAQDKLLQTGIAGLPRRYHGAIIRASELAGQSLLRRCVPRDRRAEGRKVRASQGRVPGNAWGARAYDQCNREQTADGPQGIR